ncbi:MAG: hypothetical protein AAFV07_00930 [Bacteroidota bacterium]
MQILTETLAAPCMEDFWQRDSLGQIQLTGIWANNQMPGKSSFSLPGKVGAPVWPGHDRPADTEIVIERLRISGASARIRLSGYKELRLKARLAFDGTKWILTRIAVRQPVQNARGKQGKRFCFDF